MNEAIEASQIILSFISFEEAKQYIDSHVGIKIDEALIKEEIENFKLNEGIIAYSLKIQESFCMKCGNCCRTQDPIDVSKIELKRIADYLKITYPKLKQRLSLQWRSTGLYGLRGRPCPFLNKYNRCLIYDVRPMVCRIYPLGPLVVDILEKKPMRLDISCPALKHIFLTILLCNVVLSFATQQGLIPEDENERRKIGEQLLMKTDISLEDPLRNALRQKISTHIPMLSQIREVKQL